jgi:hypothetical protein
MRLLDQSDGFEDSSRILGDRGILNDRILLRLDRLDLGLGRFKINFENCVCIIACLLRTSMVKEEFRTAMASETPFSVGHIESTNGQFLEQLILRNVVILEEVCLALTRRNDPGTRQLKQT